MQRKRRSERNLEACFIEGHKRVYMKINRMLGHKAKIAKHRTALLFRNTA